MKKIAMIISLIMVSNVKAMELSQEFKQYLFDHQLPADHPWGIETGCYRRDIDRVYWSAELVVAKRIAIEKIIKAYDLKHITLVPGYVRFCSEQTISSPSNITRQTSYEVFQDRPLDVYGAPLNEQQTNEIMTVLKCTNIIAGDVVVNKKGVYLKPSVYQKGNFVATWRKFWGTGYTFDAQATAVIEKKQESLQSYVLKCLKHYTWENPEKTVNFEKCVIGLPLLPESDEVPLEGQKREAWAAFGAAASSDLFRTNEQKESFWREYDENRAEVQRWLSKDFFKGSFNQE